MTRAELTADAVKAKTQGPELYECEVVDVEVAGERVPRCDLKRVSRGESGGEGGVDFVAAVSEDGSEVYFASNAKLTPEAPVGGLYRYETASGALTYVAQVDAYPHPEIVLWYAAAHGTLLSADEVGMNLEANYYTTRNGEFLVFGSHADVTGYESDGQEELYRYDARASEAGVPSIVCVSCNPNGAPPSIGSEFVRSSVHFDDPAGRSPRPISEEAQGGPEEGANNGTHVFFDSAESLVPQATNGKVDVYEWEADKTGSCEEAKGCVSLIGSGQDPLSSFFLDSSENGENLFFGTHAQLVPRDTDSEGDLYDARVGGGEAVEEGTPPCEGDSCDNPQAPPIDRPTASLTFSGTGNVPSETTVSEPVKKCSKPEKLKNGKCVKPKPKGKPKSRGRGRGKSARPGAKRPARRGRAGK